MCLEWEVIPIGALQLKTFYQLNEVIVYVDMCHIEVFLKNS